MLAASVGGGALTDAPPLLQRLQVHAQVYVRCYRSTEHPMSSALLCQINILSALSCAPAELYAATIGISRCSITSLRCSIQITLCPCVVTQIRTWGWSRLMTETDAALLGSALTAPYDNLMAFNGG